MTRISYELGLRDLLRRSRDYLKLGEICYCYDINTPEDWPACIKDKKGFLRRFEKRRQLYASSGKALSFWRETSPYYTKMEDEVARLLSRPVYVWPERKMPSKMRRCLQAFGVERLVTISVCCPLSAKLSGRFTLLLDSQERLDSLMERIDEVEKHLLDLHMNIVGKYAREIHPLVDYNIVSPVSAYILGCLASGEDREAVSQQLKLTLRGVDYHVSVLKQILEARTIAQLVYRASQCRLI